MLREKMRDLVNKGDDLGDRYWLNDLGGPDIYLAIKYDGEQSHKKQDNIVGLVDEEFGVIAYGHPMHMRELAEKLNKLNAIEELMS